jgi:hypothetical protein
MSELTNKATENILLRVLDSGIGRGPGVAGSPDMLMRAFTSMKAELVAAGADAEDLCAVVAAFERGLAQLQGRWAEDSSTVLQLLRQAFAADDVPRDVPQAGTIRYDFHHVRLTDKD